MIFIDNQALKLSQTALGETAPGKVVNLLSNDVNRFEFVTLFLNVMWTGPLTAVIVAILLWYEIGWAGVVGIMVIMIVVPIQSELKSIISFHFIKNPFQLKKIRF